MAVILNKTIHFGTNVVNHQVFHITSLSFALVNLKPILPGHVLVSPLRVVPRLADLSDAEVQDLFHTVQHVGRMVERVYNASALNIAIQDGAAAGQTVPHVHAHIIPRKFADMDDKGGSDAIYELLEGERGNTAGDARMTPIPKDEHRRKRNDDEMRQEAQFLAHEMVKN